MIDVFRCFSCHGVFPKAWPDRAAEEEFRRSFPGHDIRDAVVMCEPCYTAYKTYYRAHGNPRNEGG